MISLFQQHICVRMHACIYALMNMHSAFVFTDVLVHYIYTSAFGYVHVSLLYLCIYVCTCFENCIWRTWSGNLLELELIYES